MTPIAFNLTPRLKAVLPGDQRYSTLLALYEALQEAAVFEMSSPLTTGDFYNTDGESKRPVFGEDWDFKAIPIADADGWIPHKAGDPMPCDGGMIVEVFLGGDSYSLSPGKAGDLNWGKFRSHNAEIVKWRPAK